MKSPIHHSPESRRSFIRKGGLALGGVGILPQIIATDLRSFIKQPAAILNQEIQPVTVSDYLDRQERGRRLMAENHISGLYLSGGTNMLYFTGTSWWPSERVFAVILPVKGNPVWICPAFEEARAREVLQAGTDIRTWEEHESPYALVKKACADHGIIGRRLGIAPDVRNFEVQGLVKELPITGTQIVNGASVTEGCRVIKTAKEIGYLELANRITKLAYREAFGKLFEGMSTGDLASAVSRATEEMGVTGGGYPQFGPNSAFPHGSRQARNLHVNDIILIDGGCSVEGFRSDVTRTIVFGKPDDRQRQVFDIVLEAQRKAQEAVRPGVTCESIDLVARKYIEDHGFGPGYTYFAHRLGHGIGMEGHEYTYLVPGNKTLLQPGMTFSNEPGIYIRGEFGIRVEDCFVVTENGSKVLGGLESESIDTPFS